jgi:protein-S-isoprenylcysteine O-methyltransferase Ste14
VNGKQTEKSQKSSSKILLVIRGFVGILVLMVVLFLPAGRLDWKEGWIYLIVFVTSLTYLVVRGWRRDPRLMEERSKTRMKDAKVWDKIIVRIHTFLVIILIAIASLDSGRFEWTSPPLVLRILGWIGLTLVYVLVWQVFYANTYAIGEVRIQEERGHRVVTTGPYRFVRHPMYLGVIVSVFCTPVVLGSFYALIPGTLLAFLFIIRTALEDRTLKEELPGYREYAEGVKYRLLPRVW